MEEKIMTLHPDGKKGVNILRRRYDAIKNAMIDVAVDRGAVTLDELSRLVGERLPAFDGKITWYTVTVKLDLEARGIIERVSGRPHKVRIKNP